MAVTIDTGLQRLPPAPSLYTAQAATGRAVAALYDALNNDLGFEALRLTNHQIQIGDYSTADNGGAGSITSPHYVRITPGPLAQYLYVGFTYVADRGGSGAPAVALSLETAAGVVEDAGFTFSVANGLLGRQNVRTFIDAATGTTYNFFGATGGGELYTDTSWSTDATLTGRRKRLLNIGSRQGQDLVVKLALTDVRVYGVFVLEAFRREV